MSIGNVRQLAVDLLISIRGRNVYLLVLDRTHWKTNILTSLLIPYIFLNLPSLLFDILRLA